MRMHVGGHILKDEVRENFALARTSLARRTCGCFYCSTIEREKRFRCFSPAVSVPKPFDCCDMPLLLCVSKQVECKK